MDRVLWLMLFEIVPTSIVVFMILFYFSSFIYDMLLSFLPVYPLIIFLNWPLLNTLSVNYIFELASSHDILIIIVVH